MNDPGLETRVQVDDGDSLPGPVCAWCGGVASTTRTVSFNVASRQMIVWTAIGVVGYFAVAFALQAFFHFGRILLLLGVPLLRPLYRIADGLLKPVRVGLPVCSRCATRRPAWLRVVGLACALPILVVLETVGILKVLVHVEWNVPVGIAWMILGVLPLVIVSFAMRPFPHISASRDADGDVSLVGIPTDAARNERAG